MVLHTLQLGDLHFGHFAGLFFLGLVVFLMSMPLIQPAICPVSMRPCFDIDLGPSLWAESATLRRKKMLLPALSVRNQYSLLSCLRITNEHMRHPSAELSRVAYPAWSFDGGPLGELPVPTGPYDKVAQSALWTLKFPKTGRGSTAEGPWWHGRLMYDRTCPTESRWCRARSLLPPFKRQT